MLPLRARASIKNFETGTDIISSIRQSLVIDPFQHNKIQLDNEAMKTQSNEMNKNDFHLICLCPPLSLTAKMNFNISKTGIR